MMSLTQIDKQKRCVSIPRSKKGNQEDAQLYTLHTNTITKRTLMMSLRAMKV